MPTLSWIGKDVVIKHHRDVPLRLLEPLPELSRDTVDSDKLIVQGNNLPPDAGLNATYSAANRLGARAEREDIVFKQTPCALGV